MKESEKINKKVEETCSKLDQVLDGIEKTLMALKRGNELLEMILVHLGSKSDVKQMASFFQQRVAEGLDEPTLSKAQVNSEPTKQGVYKCIIPKQQFTAISSNYELLI